MSIENDAWGGGGGGRATHKGGTLLPVGFETIDAAFKLHVALWRQDDGKKICKKKTTMLGSKRKLQRSDTCKHDDASDDRMVVHVGLDEGAAAVVAEGVEGGRVVE